MKFSMFASHHGNSKKQSVFRSAFLLMMMLCTTSVSASDVVTMTTETQQAAQDRPSFSLQDSSLSGLTLLEQAYAKSNHNPVLAARLATAYIRLAREESDPDYYRKASELIQPWAKKPAIPGVREKAIPDDLRLIRATLAQHNHDYRDASADLLHIVRKQPQHVQAWLTLSTIQLVQGDYPQAEVSCSVLGKITSHWLASLCYSQLYSFTGSAERAFDLQKTLLAQSDPQQAELQLWVTGLLAETALRLGRMQTAEEYFKAGLAIKNNDTYLLRTYSEFLLAQNRSAEVITLLKKFQDNDQLLLRLAMAVKASGDEAWLSQLVSKLTTSFETAIAIHGHAHDRDAALFLLEFKDDHQQALKLAMLNWQIQKEPDDALLLLQAAKAANQPEVIQQVRDWVAMHQLQDVRFGFAPVNDGQS